ncbi:hypothetical protein E4U55_007617 [Claviceps digitariae]|nr:hypothetical protein E4U55_007617 [Claviceps digitariae]
MPLRYMACASIVGGVASSQLCRLLRIEFDAHIAETVLWVLSAQISAWLIYSIYIYPYFLSPLRHLPQPKGGLPLIGHSWGLGKHGPGVLGRKWMAQVQHAGLLRIFWLFNQEAVVVASTQAIAEILVTKSYTFEKPRFARRYLAILLGWTLLNLEGDEHVKQRRSMLPAFSFRHIKSLYPLFWTKSREVVLAMRDACCHEKGSVSAEMDVFRWALRCTLDIIGLATAGVEFGAIRDEESSLFKSYELLQSSSADFALMPLLAFLPDRVITRLPLSRIRLAVRQSAEMKQACRNMIQEKRGKEKKIDKKMMDTLSKQEENEEREPPSMDILRVALASGLFSDEQLVDQTMMFLSAGHDSTAAALTWTIYMLAQNPQAQARLRAEVREKIPSITTEITSTQVDGMAYLNAVCSESLRTHSPVAQTIRVANSDTTIQGQFIPRGSLLFLLPWMTNVDPQLWGPDAAEWKPERWLRPDQGGTGTGAANNYAFMTFLHGPRSCIGSAFAKAELACLVAAWVGSFSFELVDECNVKVTSSVVAKPKGGLRMRVRVMDGW